MEGVGPAASYKSDLCGSLTKALVLIHLIGLDCHLFHIFDARRDHGALIAAELHATGTAHRPINVVPLGVSRLAVKHARSTSTDISRGQSRKLGQVAP